MKICKRCGQEFDENSGKIFGDSVTDQDFYCWHCISVFSARKLGVKIRSPRGYYSDRPFVDFNTIKED